jgi:hypothetical protein
MLNKVIYNPLIKIRIFYIMIKIIFSFTKNKLKGGRKTEFYEKNLII